MNRTFVMLTLCCSGCFVSTRVGPSYATGDQAFDGTGFNLEALVGAEVHFGTGRPHRASKSPYRVAVAVGAHVDDQPLTGGGALAYGGTVIGLEGSRTLRRFPIDGGSAAALIRFGAGASFGFSGSMYRYDADPLMEGASAPVPLYWALSTSIEIGLDGGRGPDVGFFIGAGYRLASYDTELFGDMSGACPYGSLTFFTGSPMRALERAFR